MIELTEDIVKKFEKEDSDFEQAIGWLWNIRENLKSEQHKLHDDFRETYELSGSNFNSIADWRWKNKLRK